MPDFVPPPQVKTPLTPQMPSEPPAEVLKMNFEMDRSLLGNVEAPIQLPEKKVETPSSDTTDKKQDEPKADEFRKEEPKPEDKTAIQQKEDKPKTDGILKPPGKKEEKTDKKVDASETKLITLPDPKSKKDRDYTGFSAEEATHLKQMSNEAFEYTTKIIKENKELAKNKDGAFFQHPDAYTLHPDYRQTQVQSMMADSEAQAWKSALIACKSGKKFKVPTAFDTKTGNIILSEEVEPSEAAEEELRSKMNTCTNIQQQLNGKLENLAQTFKTRTATDMQAIQSERAKRFEWATKPELLDYTLNFPETGDVSLKQIKEDFKNLWPPYLRNNPVMEVASDIFIALRIQGAQLEQALAGQTKAEVKTSEVKRGEPSSMARQGQQGEEIGGVREFSLAGMPR